MRALVLVPVLVLAGCGGSETSHDAPASHDEEAGRGIHLDAGDVAVTSDLPGTLLDVVATRDGAMELGVTDEVLFTRLSAGTREEIEAEMARDTEDEGGLGGTIARAVTGAVAEGLALTATVPLDAVRDVRYEDGRVVIEMVDGDTSPFASTRTDDEPLLEQFDAESGQRLTEAFAKATDQ